ncbi:hypothetical protein E9531_15505 [Lampropedia puyangensis]|uniref:Uncharacterized protein n=1 Tax=Lampropedia puyangensis TaxID=1330072 RepID=A0A4S8ESF8_9BURK|nr:hypothetical protein [Lampropedia puyangensis]THT97702.1 hypothetical protein E9531_15505 [Lampropedia puyangensis]
MPKQSKISKINLSIQKDTYPDRFPIGASDEFVFHDIKIPKGMQGTTAHEQLRELERSRELLWASLGYHAIRSYQLVEPSLSYQCKKTNRGFIFFNESKLVQDYAALLTVLHDARGISAILHSKSNYSIDKPFNEFTKNELQSYLTNLRSMYKSSNIGHYLASTEINSTTKKALSDFSLNDSKDYKNSPTRTINITTTAKKTSFPKNQSEESYIRKSNQNKKNIIEAFSPVGKLNKNLLILSVISSSSQDHDHWLSMKWAFTLSKLFKEKYSSEYIGIIASKSSYGEIVRSGDQFEIPKNLDFSFTNAIYVFKHSSKLEDEFSKKDLTKETLTNDVSSYIKELSKKSKPIRKTLALFEKSQAQLSFRPMGFSAKSHICKINLHSKSDQEFIRDLATYLTIERRLIRPKSEAKADERRSSRWSFRIDLPS